MKELDVKIESLKTIKPQIYLLEFKSSYLAQKAEPGQFLHIKIDDKITILRRPFSIHRVKRDTVSVLFKVRGRGTELLSGYKKGDSLNLIGPLGKGFVFQNSLSKDKLNVLVAGGIGVAPLYFLGERLKKSKAAPQLMTFLGAKTKDELIGEKEFKSLGGKVYFATEDGSLGLKGKVTVLLKNLLYAFEAESNIDIYACGPKEMFFEIKEILKDRLSVNCQVSFEQFMGCGLGICCGCSIKTKDGYKKVCKDGPVFNLKDI